jgi:RNA recognition motif-containing protein
MNAENSLILAAGLLVVAAVAWYIIKRRGAGSTSSSSYLNEQIYVGNLPYHISEEDLRTYFSRYGVAHSVRIIRNFKTGRSKGYAFVTYNSAVQAKAALAAHGKDLEGRAMVVRIAKPRQGE